MIAHPHGARGETSAPKLLIHPSRPERQGEHPRTNEHFGEIYFPSVLCTLYSVADLELNFICRRWDGLDIYQNTEYTVATLYSMEYVLLMFR